MIWLRRVLSIPLIILFVLTFVLVLFLSHLNGTVGSARFYNGQMRQAHVYDWVYDNLTPTALDEAGIELPTDFPIDTPELKKDIVDVAKEAFPPEWLKETFEGATKQVVPYVMGDKNSFTITIAAKDRIGPMAEGINGMVDKHASEIYDYVSDELIVPAMTEQLGLGAALPYGITLTDEEIKGFVAQAMPQEEAIGWFKEMINSIAAYLKGDVNNLNLNIDLTEVKTDADTLLTALADDKLRTAFDNLSTCTLADFNTELAGLSTDTLPSCRPDVYTYDQFKQALETKMGMTFAQAVDQNVIDLIPSSYPFNDAQLREVLGPDMTESLDDARKFIVVDQGRITDQDLRDFLKSKDTETESNGSEGFDNAREVIHTTKTWIWAMWLILILLLVAIGFLCGRNWKSRLLWALGVLFVTSLILIIVVAVARSFVPDRIVDRPEGADATQVGIVMADKGDEIARNAINSFVWGFEVKLILFIVFSGLAIAGIIAWIVVERRRRLSAQQSPVEPSTGNPPDGGPSQASEQ